MGCLHQPRKFPLAHYGQSSFSPISNLYFHFYPHKYFLLDLSGIYNGIIQSGFLCFWLLLLIIVLWRLVQGWHKCS